MTERDDVVIADDDDIDDALPDEPTLDAPAATESVSETGALSDEESVEPDDLSESVDEESPPPDSVPDPAVANWQQSTGAFVLGTLDPADAAAAARAFSSSPAMQKELVSLLPVADILTSLYQSQASAGQSAGTSPVATQPVSSVSGTTAVSTGTARSAKPPRERSQPVAIPKSGGLTKSNLVIAGLGLLAAIGVLWALAQRDQIATKDQEIQALRGQLAELELGGNASVFVLNPVSDLTAGARATVFYSPGDGTVLIDGSGLPELDDDRVYQVWLQATGSNDWQPGPTFRVNSSGEVVGRLAGDTPGFARMAISEEPAPGSPEPTGEFLLEGELVRTDDQAEPTTD